jgi:hypothetical protein
MANRLIEGLKKSPMYLAVTPMEQLYEEGLKFEGETEKDQSMNHDDFNAARAIYTQLYQTLSEDGRAFLLRTLRVTVKDECLI